MTAATVIVFGRSLSTVPNSTAASRSPTFGFLPDLARRLRLARRDTLVGDLGFYETTFLTMQRKIFEDSVTRMNETISSYLELEE